MIPAEFQSFWHRLLEDHGETVPQAEERSQEFEGAESALADSVQPSIDLLRARFDKGGLHCEVEGPPSAMADFLKRVSGWEADQN
jgi:hypothetical protein